MALRRKAEIGPTKVAGMIAVKTYYLHATQVIEKMVHPTEFESVTSAFGGQ